MKRLFVKDMDSLTARGFVLVLFLSLAIVFTVLWQLDKWNTETFSLVKEISLEAELTHRMRDAVRKREISIQHMLNNDDKFNRDEESMRFLAYGAEYAEARNKLLQMKSTPEMRELDNRIREAVNYAKPIHEEFIELLVYGDATQKELRALSRKGAKAAEEVVILLDQLVNLQQARYDNVIAEHEASQKKVGIITAIVYVASLIIAIFVARLTTHRYRHVSRLSIMDGVTGSYNRYYFDMVIEDEWKRSMRENMPISLIMSDIDYFTAVPLRTK